MSGRLDFEYGFNTNNARSPQSDSLMRMYFLGDFSGAESAVESNTINKIFKIDLDSFELVMSKLAPSLELPSGQQLIFRELEDFHPDSLFEHRIFKNLRRLKKDLANAATAEKAAQEIISTYQLSGETVTQPAAQSSAGSTSSTAKNDDMFERLLGQKQSSPDIAKTHTTPSATNIDAFLADILSPHIIKDTQPEHQSLLHFIDSAIEELMNSIIHSADFQALESAWRAIRDVIFNEEYDEQNQHFYIINTDKEALDKAVAGDTSLVTKLTQHLKDTDSETHDVLIGNYQFSANNDDVTALNYLASLAESLKCQLVCAASDSLINANPSSLWHEFRQTPQASHVALTYPRVLLRIPYGEKYEEVDAFTFEEFRHSHQHDKLLWGNSAFACARLLVRQYHRLVPFDGHVAELPAFVYTQDGEQKLYPCAELLLSEQQLIGIRQQGISPFASFRNKNAIRLFADKIKAVNINS